jgi:hypothetical protein
MCKGLEEEQRTFCLEHCTHFLNLNEILVQNSRTFYTKYSSGDDLKSVFSFMYVLLVFFIFHMQICICLNWKSNGLKFI